MFKNIIVSMFCAWLLVQFHFDRYVLGELNRILSIDLTETHYYLMAFLIGIASKK